MRDCLPTQPVEESVDWISFLSGGLVESGQHFFSLPKDCPIYQGKASFRQDPVTAIEAKQSLPMH